MVRLVNCSLWRYWPMTRMLLSCSTPSILDRSWLTTVSCTPVLLAPVPLCLQMASSSSKMMIWRPLLAPSWDRWQLRMISSSLSFSLRHAYTECLTHPLLLFLRLSEQFADVGLRLAYILVKDLWAVDHLWLTSVEHLPDLPGHQRFTAAWRSKQQDALHVLTPWNKEGRREWQTAKGKSRKTDKQGAGRRQQGRR